MYRNYLDHTGKETNTISVDQNEVAAHLEPGDLLGTCAAPQPVELQQFPSYNYFSASIVPLPVL